MPRDVFDKVLTRAPGRNWKPIKVMTSHAAYGRFLAEIEDTDKEIDRVVEIRSPYAYSPRWPVYRWGDRLVFIRETSHKRYEVFAVLAYMTLHKAGGE